MSTTLGIRMIRRFGRPGPPAPRQMGLVLAVVNLIVAFLLTSGTAMAQSQPLRIIAFGDSLTAGFGLAPAASFPARLTARLAAIGRPIEVINAGVSGDTTAAGLARLEWAVPADAEAVIVELGANDALRGLPPAAARANLDAIVARLRSRGAEVLVAGMLAPRNLGSDYARAFDPIFAEVASRHDALLYPFFLDGVAMRPELNLPDGIHPNARGVEVIVERILPSVLALADRVEARRKAKRAGQ